MDQSKERDWAKCRAERIDKTWTVSDVMTYQGFFNLGYEAALASLASRQEQPVQDERLKLLQEFSDYVHLEQSSTDGTVNYSTTNINHFAFRARAMIAAAQKGMK